MSTTRHPTELGASVEQVIALSRLNLADDVIDLDFQIARGDLVIEVLTEDSSDFQVRIHQNGDVSRTEHSA